MAKRSSKTTSVWVPLQGAPKENVMKRNLIAVLSLVVMSLLLNATGAFAQSSVKANVPFDFNVGSAQLPAGTYEIQADDTIPGTVMIRNHQTSAAAMSIAQREYPRGDTTAKLVFHKVGNQYFLAEIWKGSDAEEMVIPTSRQKKELQASNTHSGGYEEIVVALN